MKVVIVSPLISVLGLNSLVHRNELWVEQFHHIELQRKSKETSGKHFGKGWTRRIERCLIK